MNIKFKLFEKEVVEVESRPKWQRMLDANTPEGKEFEKQMSHIGIISGALSAIVGLGVSIISGYREIKRDNKK